MYRYAYTSLSLSLYIYIYIYGYVCACAGGRACRRAGGAAGRWVMRVHSQDLSMYTNYSEYNIPVFNVML